MFEHVTKFANEATDTVTNAIDDTRISQRFVTTSDQVLDAVLDANRRIVDVAVTTADRVAEQLKVELPFNDRFPTPTVAGERYLEFVERAVSLNRDMNQRVAEMIKADNAKAASDKVVGAARNVADTATKVADTATKTVGDATRTVTTTAKSTAKTTAKKVPAKKVPAKKVPARKTAAKRTPARTTTARKATARTTATKTAARKSTTTKAAASK